MRFLCDENITRKIVQLLRAKGHDVVTILDLNLGVVKNSLLLLKAKELDRILVTFDADFLTYDHKYSPGILVIRITPNTDKYVLPAIEKLLPKIEETQLKNHLLIISKDTITKIDDTETKKRCHN